MLIQVTKIKPLIDMGIRAEFLYKSVSIINLLLFCFIFVKENKYVFCLGHPTCGLEVKQSQYRPGETLRVPGV